jgi:LemA protein
MSQGQLLTLLGAAVLVFWMVGAYNRLVRLRFAIGAAWAQIDTQLQRRAQALPGLVAALQAPLAAERPTLESVGAAQQQVLEAASVLRAAPVRAESATALLAALAQLDSTLTRLLALLDQQPALRGEPVVAAGLRELHDVNQRLPFARQLFNDAVQPYNEAARQFPTRLLTRLYRFGTAGRL